MKKLYEQGLATVEPSNVVKMTELKAKVVTSSTQVDGKGVEQVTVLGVFEEANSVCVVR